MGRIPRAQDKAEMTVPFATDGRANLRGSLWMTGSMAAFAVEDACLKAAAAGLPVAQVLLIFGLGGTLVFVLSARARGERLMPPEVMAPAMRVRMVFEVLGRLFHMLAIAFVPLSVATVILQAAPLVVVLGAALVFGETVGWRRWTAVFLGLAGVVVIVQPGGDGFSMLSLLAVLGMIGFAGRDLASRAAPPMLSASVLGVYGFVAIVVAGLIYLVWDGSPLVMPDAHGALLLAGGTVAGVVGYACLMKGMRTGELSAVAPFRYTRLLFGVMLGVLVFGEALSLPMLLGSGLIVSAGVFILWRGKRVADVQPGEAA